MVNSEETNIKSMASLFRQSNKKINSFKSTISESQDYESEDYENVAAWFLGSKAENASVFHDFIDYSIKKHAEYREIYYKEGDPSYITPSIKSSTAYQNSLAKISEVQEDLLKRLKGSAPFFSLRYQGHMNWDTVMPGNIGYFTAMLYNQNNVASEASPATSQLEKEVGMDLCNLIGYKETPWNDPIVDRNYGPIVPWAHITADGTIANIESMWAARNLKFYPLAVYNAIKDNACNKLKNAYDHLQITIFCNNHHRYENKQFMNCSTWELLNLSCDNILSLSLKINDLCNLRENELSELLAPYLIQNTGLINYAKSYPCYTNIRIFVPATKHYSWPKSGTLLGLGQDSIIGIPVDDNCHMNTKKLDEELRYCLENEIIVLMVVAVIGSTEEGVIDNLDQILKLRTRYEKLGLNFLIHCDAAWGGYLKSMMIPPENEVDLFKYDESGFVPSLPLSNYAQTQYNCLPKADTITIDPHKAGFIPYPAGSLSYRNKLLRELITFNAAYIHSSEDLNVGIYGIEGSKPGAAPAAVWMAHNAIPLNTDGYGQILGECSFTNKLYYCYWLTLSDDIYKWGSDANKYDFCIEPLIPLPSKIILNSNLVLKNKDEMLNFIRTYIKNKPNDEIAQNPDAILFLKEIGSDVLINSFIVNYKVNGCWNKSVTNLNKLNDLLFNKFSVTTPVSAESNTVDFIITSSVIDKEHYAVPLQRIYNNLGMDSENIQDLTFLINTTLQPWPTTHNFINIIMECFLNGIKDCIKELERYN